MKMAESMGSIDDLPDEMWLDILKKLNNFDVLYSLLGVNEKLHRLVCDISFTRLVDLLTIESSRMGDSTKNAVLDRFCMKILPEIRHKVECLTLQACFLSRVLHACSYPHLHKLVLIDFELSMVGQIFNEDSPFVNVYKQQITDLVINISDEIPDDSTRKLLTDIYSQIFSVFTNLKHLDLDGNEQAPFSQSLLTGLPSRTCFSSSIVHLRIKMQNIDDCLYLLDGRLSQLHTLIVHLDYIHDPVKMRRRWRKVIDHSWMLMNNVSNPLRLKCFSLFVYHMTSELDGMVMPLIRRMTYLEELSLSLRVIDTNLFIDATYLENYVGSQTSHLHTFHFDIVTEIVQQQQFQPTPDEIRQTFIKKGHHVDCYMDYKYGMGRCHVYSLPFHMNRMCQITANFPGGMFINVRTLHIRDHNHPLEHNFLAQISRSFPFLARLIIASDKEQKEKEKKKSSIIDFSHLVELDIATVHIDYVEQFLSDSNTRLPCLKKLFVYYRDVVSVTQNFTRKTTRNNCAQLKHIHFGKRIVMAHSKDYYLYFPSLF